MKKIFYTLSFVLLASLSNDTMAQSFTTDGGDTVRGVVYDNLNLHNNITATNNDIKIDWKVIASDFPTTWGDDSRLGICDNSLCRANSNNQLLNGSAFKSLDYVKGVKGDFHVQLTNYASAPAGTHYLSVELKEGSNQTDTIVFVITKFANNVANVSNGSNDVKLYPNPAQNTLNVSFDKNAGVEKIAIYNLIGKKVKSYSVKGSSAKLNIADTPTGIYFVRLMNAGGEILATRRFTRQ